jgi:hypothetical protein
VGSRSQVARWLDRLRRPRQYWVDAQRLAHGDQDLFLHILDQRAEENVRALNEGKADLTAVRIEIGSASQREYLAYWLPWVFGWLHREAADERRGRRSRWPQGGDFSKLWRPGE